jgi:cryptochrome 2
MIVLSDPVSLVRDHNIKEKLVELGLSVKSYNGDLLSEPWEIYDENGHAFTTFDRFWQRCLHKQMEPVSLIPPWQLVPAEGMHITVISLFSNHNMIVGIRFLLEYH